MSVALPKYLTYKSAHFTLVCGLYGWLSNFVGNGKWRTLHRALNFSVIRIMADETLGIEKGVLGIGMECVLGTVTNTGINGSIIIDSSGVAWVMGSSALSSLLGTKVDYIIDCPTDATSLCKLNCGLSR